MRCVLAFPVIFSALSLHTACRTEHGASELVDSTITAQGDVVRMNDVSVMFPLPKTAAQLGGLLEASAAGVGGALLGKQLVASMAPPPPSPFIIGGGDKGSQQ